ncbi:fimbria/pilus outer membrane usher protein, partial [Vibrio sp. V29_P1S30P107]|uniref:fimbria/pilus outer membrane usher protein n=4 Tax=Vibrio TaxID=662 RepID=UPI0013725543
MLSTLLKQRLLLVICLCLACYANGKEDGFEFDSSLLLGAHDKNALSGILESILNESLPEKGQYSLDIYINNQFYRRDLVNMVELNGSIVPCFSVDAWKSMGVSEVYISFSDNERCSVVQESTFELNKAKLTLSLLVPQAYMVSKPRGYISPAQWNFGHPAFFSNYDANYFQAKSLSSSNTGNSSSLFVGLRAGGNLGSWRLRSQFNYSYSDIGSQNQNQWNHIRSYAQTALPNWKSDLTVGQTYTADTVFDSIGFTGAEIKSDIRMKPASQRGYAPVIAGVANSVATVTVSQQGRKIYQTTVSPGPFEIRDLYSTYYQGDLDVSMQEANGKVTTFTVPFNAVSGSVRP